ncbi:hypothetical protein D3C75_1034700 [compost metagenome]
MHIEAGGGGHAHGAVNPECNQRLSPLVRIRGHRHSPVIARWGNFNPALRDKIRIIRTHIHKHGIGQSLGVAYSKRNRPGRLVGIDILILNRTDIRLHAVMGINRYFNRIGIIAAIINSEGKAV